MKKVKIFTVGGTIDKIYFDSSSEYKVGAPKIGQMLNRFKAYVDFEIITLFRKDSLDLTDEDRQLIYDEVQSSPESHILVTHGTDTMAETAKCLSKIQDKVIVLTGALLPANFRDTDAEFNVGTALGALCSKEPGVYIAMNGYVFFWDEVRKDREAQQFKRL